LVFAESGTAAKFAAVYTTTLDKLLGNTRHEVDYRDREVLVAIGAAAQAMETLEPSIWSETQIESGNRSELPRSSGLAPGQ
jgi:hypothetical protein